jgi:hypothetical protein
MDKTKVSIDDLRAAWMGARVVHERLTAEKMQIGENHLHLIQVGDLDALKELREREAALPDEIVVARRTMLQTRSAFLQAILPEQEQKVWDLVPEAEKAKERYTEGIHELERLRAAQMAAEVAVAGASETANQTESEIRRIALELGEASTSLL